VPVGVLSRGARRARLGAMLCVICATAGAVPGGATGDASGAARGAAYGKAPPDRAANVFTDPLGHRVEWRTPPGRIVSLSPSLTEILFAIGHDATTIVGRTRFCNYPTAVESIAKIGGIVDPSLEAILLLQPDLVLATRGNPLEFMESLARLGVPVYAVETDGGLARVFASIAEVGALTGREEQAGALVAHLSERLGRVVERTAGLRATERPRVYYGEIEGAHWTAGPGSFIDDLIRLTGADNVASIAPAAWSALSLEVILARDPQVYLGILRDEDSARAYTRVVSDLQSLAGWRDTSLGHTPRVFLVHEDRLQRPGPRLIDVLEELARFLHPELWADSSAAEGLLPEGPR